MFNFIYLFMSFNENNNLLFKCARVEIELFSCISINRLNDEFYSSFFFFLEKCQGFHDVHLD